VLPRLWAAIDLGICAIASAIRRRSKHCWVAILWHSKTAPHWRSTWARRRPMCGILVISGAERPFHHRMLRRLRRRGPDEIGFWSDHTIQIGHARLAIIGLDDRGTQPLESERHVLAYNGEIYNFNGLAERLRSEGSTVAGSSDAEVLLRAWARWGPAVLRDLDGFWAFVVYDKARRKLFLVRDQFG